MEMQAGAQLPAGRLQISPFSHLSIDFALHEMRCFLGALDTVKCEASHSPERPLRRASGPTEGSWVLSLQKGLWSFPIQEALP